MTFETVKERLERVMESGSIPAESVEDIAWLLSKLEAFRSAARGVFAARKAITRKVKPPSEGKAFIDAFHQLYIEHTGGKPTWGARELKVARELAKQHGLDTCVARARYMFEGKGPKWLTTRDVMSLRMHFDKLVPVDARPPTNPFNDLFAEE